MSAPIPPIREKPMKKQRLWFLLHGWFSLPIWIFFALICLTGTLATISHELTWLSNPAARASNPQHLPAQPLSALTQAVERHVPDAHIEHVIVLEPYLITAVRFSSPKHPSALAYVNPYNAQVQAIYDTPSLIEFLRSLHGWLLMPWQAAEGGGYYSWGYFLVGAMAVVILGALITGLVVYKKFWRAWSRPRIRWSAPTRTLLGDLHRHVAMWLLWFLLIISLTGGWYLTQAILWQQGVEMDRHVEILPDRALPLTEGQTPRWISVAQAEQIANQALPNTRWSLVSMPEHHRDYYRWMGQQGVLFDPYSDAVWIDPWRGTVVHIQTPNDFNVLQTLSHVADPLHFGTIGGLTTKLIWLVAGLGLLGLSITGFIIWWQRTRKDTQALWSSWSRRQRVGFRAKYLINGLLLGLPIYYFYQAMHPVFPPSWATQPIGSLSATPTPSNDLPAYRGKDGELKDFAVSFCQGCGAGIRQAWLNAGAAPLADAPDEWGRLHGSPHGFHVHAPYPAQPKATDRLWLSVQTWDGQLHRQSWPLPPPVAAK